MLCFFIFFCTERNEDGGIEKKVGREIQKKCRKRITKCEKNKKMCLIKRGLNLCLRCFKSEKKRQNRPFGDHVAAKSEYVDSTVASQQIGHPMVFLEALILTKFYENKIRLFLLILFL